MKRLLTIFGSLLLLLLVIGYLLVGRIVKEAVSRVGPMITKTAVELDSVRLGPITGWGRIGGFKLGNPKGFDKPYAITVGSVKVSVRPLSIFSNVIHVRDVVITEPEIFYDSNSKGSNLSQIQANVESFSPPSTERPKKSKKIIIDHVLIRGGKIHWKTDISLPDVELRDIGKTTNGARPSEAVSQVLKGMTGGITKAITGLGGAAKKATESIKGIFGR